MQGKKTLLLTKHDERIVTLLPPPSFSSLLSNCSWPDLRDTSQPSSVRTSFPIVVDEAQPAGKAWTFSHAW